MNKLWLLYFWRLDDEKWFDVILSLVEKFAKLHEDEIHLSAVKKYLPFKIFVFGDGKYAESIQDLADEFDDVYYFGFQPLYVIARYLPNCHYCLMPSRFLETFGLSALNALSWGLPVIWPKKWWLDAFVLSELALVWNDLSWELFIKIKWLLANNEYRENYCKKWLAISNKYHQADWEKRFKSLVHSGIKKILLVSDFTTRIGGIETYVWDVQGILTKIGYQVELFGMNIPTGFVWNILRKFWIFYALLNIISAVKLGFMKKKYKPDIIWFHSSLRWLWWLSFLVGNFSLFIFDRKKELKKKKFLWKLRGQKGPKQVRAMFHDFGYVSPFPSKINNVTDIQVPLSLWSFLKSAWTKNPLLLVWLVWKYCSIVLIKKMIKKYVDKLLVPSAYMKKIISKSYKVSENKIYVLWHFVQE